MTIVKLACGKEFNSQPKKSIVASAQAQRVVLEHSCLNGRCGACKAKVVKGVTELIQEEIALSSEEKDSGAVLTCCRAALSDIELDITELKGFPSPKMLPCKIDELESLKYDVLRVKLRLPPNSDFFYLPGQYVELINRRGVRRSYSIANASSSHARIEFYIRRVEEGKMSHYWFKEAEENDLLRMVGPLGTFCQHGGEPQNIIFLATGTGMAPIKAMLESINDNPRVCEGVKLYFYWGGRRGEDFFWTPDFKNLDLSFIPVISEDVKGWMGHKGYVQDALLSDGVNLEQSVVYACGSERMITSSREKLVSQGLCENNFHSDAFVCSGD